MVSRTTIFGFLAAMLPVGCSRFDTPSTATPVVALSVADAPISDLLAKPVPLAQDGRRFDPGDGSSPFVGDFDGDGCPDLLLGTRGREGRLLIFRNVGTSTFPRLGVPQWFDDMVPTARIPKG